MTADPGPTRHVALLVETSNSYARGLLVGVKKYLLARPGWSIYLGEHSRHEADVSWLEGWSGDGVIARIETKEIARHVRRLALPTVDLSARRLVPEAPAVETDDDTIGRWAVEHFVERGLEHLAFLADDRFAWSVNRAASFANHARSLGHQSHQFRLRRPGTAGDNRRSLTTWLLGLPKPVGVLACYDIAGQEVLEACKFAGLAVPDSVAVLGVDNDDLICNLTSPPMSSIQPDTTRTGYLAAELLDQMMSGTLVEPTMRLVAPLRIVPRQSSDLLSVDDPLVASALRFIREHAENDISVTTVLRHVGISRRSLDSRFIQHLGRTVHDEILRVRMDRVAELLINTDWTLARIAERLEFAHAEYMGVAFRRQTGRSPGQYRQANRGLRYGF